MSSISFVETPLPNYPRNYTPSLEELNSDQKKMLDMNPNTWKKGYQAREVPWDKMHYMVNSDYRIYSAGTFTDGICTNDMWEGQDLLMLDIDDGLTFNEAKDRFKGLQCLITTTKSHQKDKNGLVCDRFRVIFPTKNPITCTQSEYSTTMKLIFEREYHFSDTACKDPSRIFFGFSGAEYFYIEGKTFDFNKYLKRVQKKEKLNTTMKPLIHSSTRPQQRKTFVGHPQSTQKDFYIRTWCSDEMLEALKFGEKFVSGNRNNALLSWTKFFKGLGFSDPEVREVIFYINNSGDSVEESEIEKTIFRSQKIQG